MIKRWKGFALLVFAFLLFVPGVLAALNESLTDTQRVNLAYDCLMDKVDERGCSELSFIDKAFSVLSTGKCKTELISHSRSNECWPKERCSIIGTSQALLALSSVKQDMPDAEEWILDRKSVPKDLIWYLQLDTSGESTCKINYDGREYTINLAEDKTIDVSAGSCLVKQDSPFWLNVAASCYDKEFEITCDKDYISSFLFREKDSQTIHVSSRVTSRAADSKTFEKINSYCFGEGGTCDYEASLWATVVLSHLGYDISSYGPYLIGGADYNKEIFSAPLLYLVTNNDEYKTKTLEKQIGGEYWQENTGKYYDTALALLPFGQLSNPQKDGAIDWLFDVQGDDGCWDNGNIRNNGFLLYSIWPRSVSSTSGSSDEPSEPDNDCVLSGYSCVASVQCEIVDRLEDYDCSGYSVCCGEEEVVTPPTQTETCSSLGGEICSSEEYCSLGTLKYPSDISLFEKCCVGGTCKTQTTTPEDDDPIDYDDPSSTVYTCESSGGTCEAFGCQEGYELSSSYTCADYADCCFVESASSEDKKSYWWVWVLIILIILTVIGIIYKDEIQKYIEDLMDKDKGKDKPKRPGFPGPGVPSYMKNLPPHGMPRKIMPKPLPSQPSRPMPQPTQQQRPQQGRPTPQRPLPKPKTPQELEEVLRKLKEISK